MSDLIFVNPYNFSHKLENTYQLKTSTISSFFRRVNVSHFGDRSKCWNELLTQKAYVILLQPSFSAKGRRSALFKARYDEPLGAAIDFSLDMERKLLKAIGMY